MSALDNEILSVLYCLAYIFNSLQRDYIIELLYIDLYLLICR